MRIIDKYKFEHRGGRGCSNSDYHLHKTTCCGSFCVEDDELMNLYLDPNDLSKVVKLWGEIDCPFCGSKDWELKEILAIPEVPSSWHWASYKR